MKKIKESQQRGKKKKRKKMQGFRMCLYPWMRSSFHCILRKKQGYNLQSFLGFPLTFLKVSEINNETLMPPKHYKSYGHTWDHQLETIAQNVHTCTTYVNKL